MIHRLEEIEANQFIYFGNFSLNCDLSPKEHAILRRLFLESLNGNDLSRNAHSAILVVSELDGRRDRIHYHYCMYSDSEWSQRRMKKLCDEIAGTATTIVDHDPPKKGIEPACNYMFKHLPGYRGGQ